MSEAGLLFVGHDAARAGAQIELLHLLGWLKRHGKRPFSVLLDRGGELTPEFQRLSDTWTIEQSRWRPDALRTQILIALGYGGWAKRAETSDVRRFVGRNSPGLIYTNSIASARVIGVLAPTVPIITHVHELEFQFRTHASEALARLLAQTRRFIACSNATRDNLVSRHGIPPEKVETVYESIPVGEIRAERTRAEVFQELELPDDALLIVGSGTPGWRKGSDLFIQLAKAVSQRHTRAYFAWIGGSWPVDNEQFEHDMRLGGLNERVRFVGSVQKPYDYVAAAELFALPSREDPYPLVCLEAAALGKPVICFAKAGGMPEFVEDDCGYTVPSLDVAAMAERVEHLLDQPELREAMGTSAQGKVQRRHDVGVAGPQILEIIERTIAGG